MPNADHTRIFAAGQFLGDLLTRRRLPAFELAHRVPTVHQDAVQEHAHAEAHYVLFMRGRYVSTAHGAPLLATHPMLIYNPPGVVHRDCFQGDGAGGRFFTLSPDLVTVAGLALPSYALVLDGDALRAAGRIAHLVQRGDRESLQMESLCTELLAATTTALDSCLDLAPRWLKRALELLRDDCGRDMSLAEVARTADVHPVHLTRVFRRHLRCTPGDYLRRCRLDRAAALLAARGPGLSEIAQACGYFDQAHFSRAFKQAYGVPPKAYRQVYLVQDQEGSAD
jgi:AraC family transcriptional regulator